MNFQYFHFHIPLRATLERRERQKKKDSDEYLLPNTWRLRAKIVWLHLLLLFFFISFFFSRAFFAIIHRIVSFSSSFTFKFSMWMIHTSEQNKTNVSICPYWEDHTFEQWFGLIVCHLFHLNRLRCSDSTSFRIEINWREFLLVHFRN